jgi:hypothetical protein
MQMAAVEVESGKTGYTRIKGDLLVMLTEITLAEGTSSAEFLDPIIRPEIENRHKANLPAIKILRAARERAAKLRDERPVMQNDFGAEG